MRSTVPILLQALARCVLAVPVESTVGKDSPKFDWHKGMTREQEGHKIVPGGTAPEIQELVPLFTDYAPGLKRVKIRYGKYTLPKVSATTLSSMLTGEQGTLSTIAISMKKPCDECSLVTMQAGLEYQNGSLAEPSNGGWLHHVVMIASGSGRTDAVCNMPIERFFSSGNEKTTTAFGDVIEKQVKAAFPITKSDTFSAQLELMNLLDVPLDVWLTVDYEYMSGPKKADWLTSKALWLDVTNCGASSVRPPPGKQQFKLASKKWTSPYDGVMLGVGGHLHDGGTNVNIYQNDKVICDSKAEYTASLAGGASTAAPHGSASAKDAALGTMADVTGMSRRKRDGLVKDGMAHIKQMSTCNALGPIKKGDTVFIDANYNFNQHMGMKSKAGAYTEVMGIAILYLALKG